MSNLTANMEMKTPEKQKFVVPGFPASRITEMEKEKKRSRLPMPNLSSAIVSKRDKNYSTIVAPSTPSRKTNNSRRHSYQPTGQALFDTVKRSQRLSVPTIIQQRANLRSPNVHLLKPEYFLNPVSDIPSEFPCTCCVKNLGLLSPEKKEKFVYPTIQDATEDYLHKNFQMVDKLGGGSFSQVIRVTRLSDRQQYAVKSLKPYKSSIDRQKKFEELQCWYEISRGHKHVVQLYASWEQGGVLHMLAELCSGGTLEMYLRSKSHDPLQDKEIWCFTSDISAGLGFIHGLGYAHLDLKPANIILTQSGLCKITDFGLANKIEDLSHKRTLSDDHVGDNLYLAPEALRGEFSLASDVFALGLIVLEMISNSDLPNGDEAYERLRTGDISDFFPHIPQSTEYLLVAIVQACLSPVACLRPSINQVLQIQIISHTIQSRRVMPDDKPCLSESPERLQCRTPVSSCTPSYLAHERNKHTPEFNDDEELRNFFCSSPLSGKSKLFNKKS